MNLIKRIVLRWKNHSSNLTPHMSEVVHTIPSIFFIKALSASLALLFSVMVARYLGVDAAGVFFLSLAIVTSASVISRLGMDNVLLRFVTVFWVEKSFQKVNGIFFLSSKIIFFFSVFISLLLFLFSTILAQDIFQIPELELPLKWMVLAILPIAIFNIIAEGMKGIKRIEVALIIQGLLLPFFAIIAMFPFMELYGSLLGVSIAYLFAGTVVCLFAILGWVKYAHVQVGSLQFPPSSLWKSSQPLFTVTLIGQVVIPYCPIFVLGVYASESDVGLFGAAIRLVIIISFFLVAVNNIIAPKFAELYKKGDLEEIEVLAKYTSKIYLLFGFPVFFIYVFFGDIVMGIFGEGFESGKWVLAALSLGQFVNVATGSVGFLLMMCGEEKSLERLTVYSSLLLLILLFFLVPSYGVIGAAVASSLALIALNVGSVYSVKKNIGIMPIAYWGRKK